MPELEIEFKNLLTADEHHTLYHTFFKTEQKQSLLNYYIDTENLDLRKNTLLLRIRVTAGEQMMTLKAPTEKGILEFNAEVDYDLSTARKMSHDDLPEIITHELKTRNIDVDDLIIYGSLTTERFETGYKDGLLVLDQSSFLGTQDFEIEYEVTDYDQGETRFDNLLESYKIERRPEMTKSERFYQVLRKEKDES